MTRRCPVGKHPFSFISVGQPNGVTVTICSEELLALRARRAPNMMRFPDPHHEGEQFFGSGFVEIESQLQIPALLDQSNETPAALYSIGGSILLYLAEKFGRLLFPAVSPVCFYESCPWLFRACAEQVVAHAWVVASGIFMPIARRKNTSDPR